MANCLQNLYLNFQQRFVAPRFLVSCFNYLILLLGSCHRYCVRSALSPANHPPHHELLPELFLSPPCSQCVFLVIKASQHAVHAYKSSLNFSFVVYQKLVDYEWLWKQKSEWADGGPKFWFWKIGVCFFFYMQFIDSRINDCTRLLLENLAFVAGDVQLFATNPYRKKKKGIKKLSLVSLESCMVRDLHSKNNLYNQKKP